MLSKTAFSVVVERSAKFARTRDSKLRIYPERCNKEEDLNLRNYDEELRRVGMPFGMETSDKYGPLSVEEIAATLYEFAIKFKISPMVQLADLFLWPICMGHHASN